MSKPLWVDFSEAGGEDRALNGRIIKLLPGECREAELSAGQNLHWIVVKGEATIFAGEAMKVLKRDHNHVVIPGAGDRVENRGHVLLEIAEVRLTDPGGND